MKEGEEEKCKLIKRMKHLDGINFQFEKFHNFNQIIHQIEFSLIGNVCRWVVNF
jgi:hypothetical protein